MLQQHWPDEWSIADALGIAASISRIARVLSGKGDGDDFDQVDWTLENRVAAALIQVHLAELPLDRLIRSLSGGERVRIGLARLLLEQPDMLLLDEPTNNLDSAGRDVIAALVTDWRGGLMVASHDRVLLEMMDRIVELNPLQVSIVGGGWSAFVEARDADRERRAAEVARAKVSLKRTKQVAQERREAQGKRDKAGKAFAASGSQAKVLLGKKAERAENSSGRTKAEGERMITDAAERASTARANIEVIAPLTIALPATGIPSSARIADVKDACISLGTRNFGPWNMTIVGPERIAVEGPNGAGKTTFLKLVSGQLEASSGTVDCQKNRIAVLDQHVGILDWSASVLNNVSRLNANLDKEQLHAACAHFAFRNRDADQIVGTLSGGERMRAGLAAIFASLTPPWLLILDEPTNHLDIESAEILETALQGFDGALLIVSHDRTFLKNVGVDRTIKIEACHPV